MVAKIDEQYMREALKEAERALAAKDRPIGAVIVHQGQILARAHHQVKLLRDPTAHATIIAITQAANAVQSDQLPEAVVYVTQEPCAMCTGALLLIHVGATNRSDDFPRERRAATGATPQAGRRRRIPFIPSHG